jgi:hypothetical protein
MSDEWNRDQESEERYDGEDWREDEFRARWESARDSEEET